MLLEKATTKLALQMAGAALFMKIHVLLAAMALIVVVAAAVAMAATILSLKKRSSSNTSEYNDIELLLIL